MTVERGALLDLLNETCVRLAGIADAVGDHRSAADAREIPVQERRADLNVLVVGQYKRGKSTLINALLGEDLMPTGALPVTGVLTVSRYGVQPALQVRFTGGAIATIRPNELSKFVSEAENPNNTRGVDRVEITWPAHILEGLALYDTPGIGSIWEHNSALALDALERTDAAILVIGPDPPIGATELAFARDVARSSERLFVVMNKADTSDALEEVLAFSGQALAGVLGRTPAMYALSARQARDLQQRGEADPRLESFRSGLRAFVAELGDATRTRSLRRRALAIVNRVALIVDMRRRAQSLTIEQRSQAHDAALRAIQVLDDRIRTLDLLVDDDVKALRLRLEEELVRFRSRDQVALRAHAVAVARISDADRRSAAFLDLVRERADVWRLEIIDVIKGVLASAEAKYSRTLSEIEAAALAAGCHALNLQPVEVLQRYHITIPGPRIDYIPSLAPQTGLELLLQLAIGCLPRSLRVRIRERQLDGIFVQELDGLAGKMRYGISGDLETWRQATRAYIRSSLAATRDIVLNLFEESPGATENSGLSVLDDWSTELASMQSALEPASQASVE